MDTPTTETHSNSFQPTAWQEFLRPRTAPLLVLLLFQLLLNLSIATFFEVQGEEMAGPVIGSVFSQIVLLAVWCTLAPFSFGVRYVIGTILFCLTSICMYICANRDGGGVSVAMSITGAMFVQWLLYQMPLWHTRWTGWYLTTKVQEDGEGTVSVSNELQFGIAQLFVWTTIAAIFLGFLRMLITFFGDDIRGNSVDLQLFPTIALGNALLVLPLIYACFSRTNMPLWLGIAAVWALGVSFAQMLLLNSNGGDNEFFMLINVAQFIAVLLTLMLVRLAGVRLRNQCVTS